MAIASHGGLWWEWLQCKGMMMRKIPSILLSTWALLILERRLVWKRAADLLGWAGWALSGWCAAADTVNSGGRRRKVSLAAKWRNFDFLGKNSLGASNQWGTLQRRSVVYLPNRAQGGRRRSRQCQASSRSRHRLWWVRFTISTTSATTLAGSTSAMSTAMSSLLWKRTEFQLIRWVQLRVLIF